MTRNVVLGAFTVVVAMVGAWAVARNAAGGRESAPSAHVSSDDRVAELEQELAQVRRQLQYMAAQPKASAGPAAEAPPAAEPAAQEPPAKPKTEEEKRLAREKGRQAIAEKFARLSTTLAQQPRDPVWAETAEKELRGVVHQIDQSGIKGAKVLSSECKASICKVDVSYDSPGAQAQISAKIRSPFFSGNETLRYEENGQLRSTSYYYRQGYDRPQ